MSQNTTHAVMAQRAEAHDSLDDFPTQPWGTRALMEHVLKSSGFFKPTDKAWEPACNRGFMARPLREYFARVFASDIFDYGWGGQEHKIDFLWPDPLLERLAKGVPDWVITNPPFRLAEQFIERGRAIAAVGCAVLVRTQFLEGVGRYERLFSIAPPTYIAQFTERLPMVKGRCDPDVSTATSYAWLVWIRDLLPRGFVWIPPCRRQLERPGDYGVPG